MKMYVSAVSILLLLCCSPLAFAGGGGGGSASSPSAGVSAEATVAAAISTIADGGPSPCPAGKFNENGICKTINRLINELLSVSYTFSALTDIPNPNNIEQSAVLIVKLSAFPNP